MDPKAEEYKLLLRQREILLDTIHKTYGSFHTAVFSSLTVLSAVLTLLFYLDRPLSVWYLFLLVQVVMGLFFFVAGLLLSTNRDRDYVRAIDTYLRETYQIKRLFYQGELSYRHINHVSGRFSWLTTAGGVAAALLLICGLVVRRAEVWAIAAAHPPLTVLVVLEILFGLWFIAQNFRYKVTAESRYYTETLEFLRRGELPPRQKKVFGRR